MPTVFTVAGLRFFFYSNEGVEPPHVHVEKGDAIGKWWLADLQQDHASGFTKAEIRRIRTLLVERRQELIDAWETHFG